jgi:hypothetical protein
MHERRHERRKRESRMLMATARQSRLSVAQCVAPAFARRLAESQERATAGMRPLPGGRWLTGFKDLWLTGPLSASEGPAASSFRDAGEACVPGIQSQTQHRCLDSGFRLSAGPGMTVRDQGIVNTIN